MAVLGGTRNLLSKLKPNILLSVHSDELREECLNFLRKMNYHDIQPINGADISDATEFAVTPEFLSTKY
jgi:hypothetical protein